MYDTQIKWLLCESLDHNPNPCRMIPEGGLCVECGGLVPNEEALKKINRGQYGKEFRK